MGTPVPLTVDPSDPDSPEGAIPVSIFGVDSGGGGDDDFEILPAALEDPFTGFGAAILRAGHVVNVVVEASAPSSLAGAGAATVCNLPFESPFAHAPISAELGGAWVRAQARTNGAVVVYPEESNFPDEATSSMLRLNGSFNIPLPEGA